MTTESPAQRAAISEMADTWRRVTGGRPELGLARDLVAKNWPVTIIEAAGHLAEHAVTQQTGYAQQFAAAIGDRPEGPTRALAALLLHDLLGFIAAAPDTPPQDAVHWLEIVAGAPDMATARAIEDLLDTFPTYQRRRTEPPAVAWNRALTGALAPLAFAAGLTLDEAAAMHTAGRLDEPGLRTLAGLRGYRLALTPPAPTPSDGHGPVRGDQ